MGFRDTWASQVSLVVNNPPANIGNVRDMGLILGLGRSPEERHGNPLQYSCLENLMDTGAWRAAVQGVAKSHSCSISLVNEYSGLISDIQDIY